MGGKAGVPAWQPQAGASRERSERCPLQREFDGAKRRELDVGSTRARSSARSADERLRSPALRGFIAQRPVDRWVGRTGAK